MIEENPFLDEDQAHEAHVQRIFQHDEDAVRKALAENVFSHRDTVNALTKLIWDARKEGPYPQV